mmetsp:Transcript_43308/g.51963  ORF Transcript_43308/g.51963 Transcript_43308/m.51963 type:complete len:95 (-) Transcript_43308:1565-1849(-)
MSCLPTTDLEPIVQKISSNRQSINRSIGPGSGCGLPRSTSRSLHHKFESCGITSVISQCYNPTVVDPVSEGFHRTANVSFVLLVHVNMLQRNKP